MKVVGYIRVSTDTQDQSGLGLADQEANIRMYCKLYKLELVGIEKDAASGKNLDRSGLQAALASLKKGEVDGLIVSKLDRLTRNVSDMGFLLENYFKEKFSFFVVAEQIDTRSAAGRLMLNILTGVAQWERETIQERTKAALAQKRVRGEKTGGYTPYGYNASKKGNLSVNTTEQDTIRRIIELRDAGNSYQAIAKILNRTGIKTKLGKDWVAMTVYRICQNGEAA